MMRRTPSGLYIGALLASIALAWASHALAYDFPGWPDPLRANEWQPRTSGATTVLIRSQGGGATPQVQIGSTAAFLQRINATTLRTGITTANSVVQWSAGDAGAVERTVLQGSINGLTLGGAGVTATLAGVGATTVTSDAGSTVTVRDSGTNASVATAANGITTITGNAVPATGDAVDVRATAATGVVRINGRNLGTWISVGGATDNITLSSANVTASTAAVTVSTLAVGGGAVVTRRSSATALLNFGTIAAQSAANLTMTVTGVTFNATPNSTCTCSASMGTFNSSISWDCAASAADTVRVEAFNGTAGGIDPDGAGAQWRATCENF